MRAKAKAKVKQHVSRAAHRSNSSNSNGSGGSVSSSNSGSGGSDLDSVLDKVSQKALADASGLSQSLISRIKSHDIKQRRGNLKLDSLLKLRRGLSAVTGRAWTLDDIAVHIGAEDAAPAAPVSAATPTSVAA